jgi:hypothetical protein
VAGEPFLTYPLRDDRCRCCVNLSRRRSVGPALLLATWAAHGRRVAVGQGRGLVKIRPW